MIRRSFLLILCLFSTLGWAESRLDMAGLVKLLVAQGYHDIREVELEGDKFEVETLDAQGQRVRLQVDAHTGDIKKRPTRPLYCGLSGRRTAGLMPPSVSAVEAGARDAAACRGAAPAGRRPAADRLAAPASRS